MLLLYLRLNVHLNIEVTKICIYILGEAIAIGKHLYALKKEGTIPINTNNVLWLIGSLGLDLRSGNSDKNNKKGSQYSIGRNRWKSVFTGGIFVEPHMPELAEFKRYFLETVKVICQTIFVLLPFTTKISFMVVI